MNPSAQALADYMSELSEDAFSARWMDGLEFELWSALLVAGRCGRSAPNYTDEWKLWSPGISARFYD